MSEWIFIRHAQILAVGSDHLTQNGELKSLDICQRLAFLKIEKIYSSPSLRCVRTVTPLSEKMKLPIIETHSLKERKLSTDPLDSYPEAIKSTFLNPDFSYPGGEAITLTKTRLLQFIKCHNEYEASVFVACTHGVNVAIMKAYATKTDYLQCWLSIAEGDCLFFKVSQTKNNFSMKLLDHDNS